MKNNVVDVLMLFWHISIHATLKVTTRMANFTAGLRLSTARVTALTGISRKGSSTGLRDSSTRWADSASSATTGTDGRRGRAGRSLKVEGGLWER